MLTAKLEQDFGCGSQALRTHRLLEQRWCHITVDNRGNAMQQCADENKPGLFTAVQASAPLNWGGFYSSGGSLAKLQSQCPCIRAVATQRLSVVAKRNDDM